MKKLLLLLVAFSFIAVMPKVASAFTLDVMINAEILDIDLQDDGYARMAVRLSNEQASQYGADKIIGILIPQFTIGPLTAAMSNAANLKGPSNVHLYAPLDISTGDRTLEAFHIGKADIPKFSLVPPTP